MSSHINGSDPGAAGPTLLTVEINNEARERVQETITTTDRVTLEEKENDQKPELLMLVSVTLKEAALDSPSFRASVNHYHNQITSVEVWMAALESSIEKVVKLVRDLEIYLRSYLEYLVPLFLLDGMLDPEYTYLSLNTTERGLQDLVSISMGLLHFSMPRFAATKDLILERIAVYKTFKRRFDSAQSNYDRGLSMHMATAKQKDPKFVMEDSHQLYTVRKEYLARALDMVVELNDVSDYINARLIRFSLFTWQQKLDRFASHPIVSQLFSEVGRKLTRIACWSEHNRESVGRFRKDMKMARAQIEASALAACFPSRRPADYLVPAVNAKMLNASNETATEKHGYLFMKTHIDKSSKPLWVKRWAFILGGFFSLLELAPSLTSVQETDKIGLLLCNVKYTANEDRRLCFELKTIDTTVVFQTETLAELRLWLKVFENASQLITQDHGAMRGVFDLASSRYPPLIAEFASTVNTASDRALTSGRTINREGHIVTSSRLSTHIMRDDKLFSQYILNEVIKIRLPLLTEASRSAVIAYSLSGATAAPTAVSANIWGSMNWGYHHLLEDSYLGVYRQEADVPLENFTRQIGNGICVPENYPNSLLPREIQLRALFESEVDPRECCLLAFNGLWSPNPRQELRGTIFVTQKNCFSYVHSLGFVALHKVSLENLVECVCTKKKDHDLLRVYKLRGSLQARLYLDDGQLVALKYNHLIRNVASDQPHGVEELICELQQVESDYRSSTADLSLSFNPVALKTPSDLPPTGTVTSKAPIGLIDGPAAEPAPAAPAAQPSQSVPKPAAGPSAGSLAAADARLANDPLPFINSHVVRLPPKVILHMLFGAHSSVLDLVNPVIVVKLDQDSPWMRTPDGRGLFRDVNASMWFLDGRKDALKTHQEIEEMQDNEMYCLRITGNVLRVKYLTLFRLVLRIVIVGLGNGGSKIFYFSKVAFCHKRLFNLVMLHACNTHTRWLNRNLNRVLDHEARTMGSKGRVVKAVYKYGKLPVTDEPQPQLPEPVTTVTASAIFRVLLRGVIGQVLRFIIALVLMFTRACKLFASSLSMHKFLVFVIVCLTVFNLYLSKMSLVSYWQERQAGNLVREMITAQPMYMERALYLEDIKTVIEKDMLHGVDSVCFNTFKNESLVFNYDHATAWRSSFEDRLTRDSTLNIRRTLKQVGIRRNELMVQINMLNQLEEDIARGEWRNWLRNELDKCEYIRGIAVSNKALNDTTKDIDGGVQNVLDFCDCCSHELSLLN